MKLKTIGLASLFAITTSFTVMAANHQAVSGSSIWGRRIMMHIMAHTLI